jgi:hypothetical protein
MLLEYLVMSSQALLSLSSASYTMRTHLSRTLSPWESSALNDDTPSVFAVRGVLRSVTIVVSVSPEGDSGACSTLVGVGSALGAGDAEADGLVSDGLVQSLG